MLKYKGLKIGPNGDIKQYGDLKTFLSRGWYKDSEQNKKATVVQKGHLVDRY